MDESTAPQLAYLGDYLVFWGVFVVAATVTVLFVRSARKRGGAVRVVAGNVLILLTLLSAAAVAGETFLRYVFDGTLWYKATLTTESWFVRHVELNSHGYRDVEWDLTKPAGVERLLFVGDSFTLGYGVADPGDRFSDRIRDRLLARAPGRFQVWNVGRIGATTADELQVTSHVLSLMPVDRVVLAYSPNDVEDLLPREDRDAWFVDPPAGGSLARRSFLADFLRVWIQLVRSDHAESYFGELERVHADSELWAAQQARIREFASLCRTRGARLDVAIFPLFSHWAPDYPFRGIHRQTEKAWRGAGATVVDLADAYAGVDASDLRVNVFDPHPNERAHELAADAMLAAFFEVE